MTRARKSQGKSEDKLAKELFTGSQSETGSETSPVKTTQQKRKRRVSSTKEATLTDSEQGGKMGTEEQHEPSAKTPRQVKETVKPQSKKRPRQKKPKAPDSGEVDHAVVANDDDDGVVTFNFEASSSKKVSKTPKTDVHVDQPGETSTVPQGRKKKSGKVKTSPEENVNSDSVVTAPALQASEKTEDVQEIKDVAVVTADETQAKEKSGKKRKSRKRKAQCQENNVPAKKPHKSDKDIFFYCGNLPPGVTQETLRYFLEEEGIHPNVTLHRMKRQEDQSIHKLTAKQRQYKKNVLKAAKLLFATVIVKTEEEARKMSFLNGVSMPSTSQRDLETELKMVRRLPRPDKFSYKVHISGLHPNITQEELKLYLEGRDIKPKAVVIIRSQQSQKSKRYGFVWFESVSDADKAVDLPEPLMRNRPLTIKHSFKKMFKNV